MYCYDDHIRLQCSPLYNELVINFLCSQSYSPTLKTKKATKEYKKICNKILSKGHNTQDAKNLLTSKLLLMIYSRINISGLWDTYVLE